MKLVKAVKATPQVFPLTTVAGRVALLTGIAAKTVTDEELEAAVLHDTETRQHRKPVYAYGKRYTSIRNAAIAAIRLSTISGIDYAKKLNAMEKRIAYLCNKDQTVGFYWAK